MPIKRELRWFYPSNWPDISRRVRFERAGGVCEGCGRPHGETVRCLPDGRWFDRTRNMWRNDRGRPARWPDIVEGIQFRHSRVILAAAHLDHDPRNNRLRNLKSLCQRCHITHDRTHHLARRRVTYLWRRALGDLFFGPYTAHSIIEESRKTAADGPDARYNTARISVPVPRPQTERLAAPLAAGWRDRAAQQRLELERP